MLTKSRSTVVIRLEDDSQFVAAAAKLADLEAREGELNRSSSDLRMGISRGAVAANLLTARAERLLADDVVPLSTDAQVAALRRDLGAVEDELRVVRRAIELHRPVVERERQRVSAAICERLRPQHRAIVGRIASALTELVAALQAEHDFRETLNVAGVQYTTTLRPMPLAALGLFNDPNDPDSAAALWLREAREHGLID